MIEVALTPGQRRALFPAYLLVNDALEIIEVGPFYARIGAKLAAGESLEAHFEPIPANCDLAGVIARAAQESAFVQLRCRGQFLLFGGCALRLRNGYLLGLCHVPQASAIDVQELQISDYSVSDPTVPVLMLLSLQRALLEEAQDNALELSHERERGFNLAEQVRRVGSYAAHDFNNFLSIIDLNALRLLNSPALSDRDRRLIGIILETTRRGSELVGSLQRITGSSPDAAASLVVDEALQADHAFLSTVVGSRIAVRLDLGAPGARIGTSRTEFFNCLTNLLINARDAMLGGGEITIATRLKAVPLATQPGGEPGPLQSCVAVAVSDNGIGMDAETLARAFEPHYSTKAHGSGLGLSSVQEYARSVGGEACVSSTPGRGATFYLYLPRLADNVAPPPRVEPPAVLPRARPIRILLVDDEPYAVEALAEMLVDLGYAVCSAASSAAALELAEGQRFDLVLTDVVMPDIDGLELARRMVAQQPGIGVVLMSGYMPPAAEFGAGWQFAKKPLDQQALLNCFDAAIAAFPPG